MGRLLLSLLVLCAAAIIAPPEASGCIKQIVPAYFYPYPHPSFWDVAIDDKLAPGVAGRVLIMNPASGPGNTLDPNYAAAVSLAKSRAAIVVGYVHTSYGRRPSNSVKAEILKYKEWYGVDGIFIDEVLTTSVGISYYKGLAIYVRGQILSGRVILNPGAAPVEGYMMQVATGADDTVVIFEGALASYNTWKQPAWVIKYPAEKFSHLVYGAPSLSTALTRARYVGFVYITNDTLPNPWDTLPSYWQAEAATYL